MDETAGAGTGGCFAGGCVEGATVGSGDGVFASSDGLGAAGLETAPEPVAAFLGTEARASNCTLALPASR